MIDLKSLAQLDPSKLSISTKTALLAALAAATVTATSIFAVQHFSKRNRIQRVKEEIAASLHSDSLSDFPHTSLAATTQQKIPPRTSEHLVREQLARNYAFLGEEGVSKVRGAFVVVVGLGGVGSHAAHMLARSGVERLRVVDFDQVSLSSLNRHAVATQADVGTAKSECLKEHFGRIAPQVVVEAMNVLFSAEAADDLLAGNPDYVLDCIDNLNTKIDLITVCKTKGLKIISSMGAGAKSDPSRIQIADVSETFEDPLARATRRGLKLKGIESGVTVVYSTEKPGSVKLLPLDDDKFENADEYSALPDFRVRILPVLGTLPALFGMAMASHVVTELAGWPTEPLAVKGREKTYVRLHRDLINSENAAYSKLGQLPVPLPLDVRDVAYLFEEIWRGRSALSGSFEKLRLIRWDPALPASMTNIVCLTRGEVTKHPIDASPSTYYSPELCAYVASRFEEERRLAKYR